jgi:hypothetical protein
MSAAPGVIAVFAKPPLAGLVKTRLAATIGSESAATLAQAFFADTWAALSRLSGARLVLAATVAERGAYGLDEGELWLQGEGDLGQRMERIAQRALSAAPWFLALGTDSPGLPAWIVEAAWASLTHHDAVLGPAVDGGFYLLGLRRVEPGLLSELPWSVPSTFAATAARLRARGYSFDTAASWFDVDEVGDLSRLTEAIAQRHLEAPCTVAALASLGLG